VLARPPCPALYRLALSRAFAHRYLHSFPTRRSSDLMKAIFSSPLYWVMLVLMVMTATTELGTQAWVERILAASGAQPLLVLALVTVLMAVGRLFAGPLIHRLNISGVLLGSAIISAVAIYTMHMATGGMVYIAAILF